MIFQAHDFSLKSLVSIVLEYFTCCSVKKDLLGLTKEYLGEDIEEDPEEPHINTDEMQRERQAVYNNLVEKAIKLAQMSNHTNHDSDSEDVEATVESGHPDNNNYAT